MYTALSSARWRKDRHHFCLCTSAKYAADALALTFRIKSNKSI